MYVQKYPYRKNYAVASAAASRLVRLTVAKFKRWASLLEVRRKQNIIPQIFKNCKKYQKVILWRQPRLAGLSGAPLLHLNGGHRFQKQVGFGMLFRSIFKIEKKYKNMGKNNTSKATKHFLATNCVRSLRQEYGSCSPPSQGSGIFDSIGYDKG